MVSFKEKLKNTLYCLRDDKFSYIGILFLICWMIYRGYSFREEKKKLYIPSQDEINKMDNGYYPDIPNDHEF